ncbi:hypothetical protein H0H93_014637, partial [Arthromyces matolae]
MSVPSRRAVARWGSVGNILSLMDAAVGKDTNLLGPRDRFEKDLERIRNVKGLKIITNDLNDKRRRPLQWKTE